jgi:flagellar hook-associated protein 1 FlgK
VDVDAELAVMLQLQNAYAANARVIAAADEMWRSLLAAV